MAYDEDLRWRIVYQRYSLQLNHEIATNLNIDQSTVCHMIALFDATRDVKKAKYSQKGQSHHLQKLTEIDHHLIMEAVIDRPGIPVRNTGVFTTANWNRYLTVVSMQLLA